jgi:DnaJ family protein C protein 9
MNVIADAFGDAADLYSILNVPRSASVADIKRAYKQSALRHHPDKNGGSTSSATKFKAVSLAHTILSDPVRRAEYDATGLFEEGHLPDHMSSEHWRAYFERLFPRINVERIEAFRSDYVGSKEERTDVLEAYQRGDGDLDVVLECVLFASVDNVERYLKLIEEAIAAGEVLRLPKLAKSSTPAAQQRRSKKEKREAAESIAEKAKLKKRPSAAAALATSSLCDLAAQLRSRNSGLSSFADTVANLEQGILENSRKKPRRK